MKLHNRFPDDIPVLHRETFTSSNGPCTLVYGDDTGRIRIGCFFGATEFSIYDLELVPDKIADQGAEAVRSFGHEKIDELIKIFHEDEDLRKMRIRDLNAVYQIEVDGVTVKGFVRTHNMGGRTGQLKLVMTEPFQLECYLHIRPSCFAEAMGQRRTFGEDGCLLPQETQRHVEALMALYKKERHRRTRPPEHPTLKALATQS